MDPTVVAAWIAAGISALTLLGTLAAQYFGYRATSKDAEKTAEEQRRQLDRTLAEQREQLALTLNEQRTRTLNERFTTAAEQLGSDKPAVRLAGVYAMAGLADDWAGNRQVCIDVLCAYLQLPYEPDPGGNAPVQERLAFQTSQKVRHTVIRVIAAHLGEDAATSWQGLSFDLRGVVFDGGDFGFARFSSGMANFSGAEFSAGTVGFRFTKFSGGAVFFRGAKFSGGAANFSCAEFSAGEVSFNFAEFCGSTVDFFSAEFSGGTVEFIGAEFSAGEVSFNFAEFSGGTVDFSRSADWSVPPKFPWTDTPPPSVKLPDTSIA
jgi:hypothetical protein